ncbi:30S ribosomal protein S3 [Patescibacteria group bacterium]|nr:30S ribosomal protein S3 [Patescibacteria group bacterium]MBU4458439.1 30S ribosomal protein S3 [Patescibacteria group bacterium]MCG2695969.1 30S ribosomal protein S3 [Candidatus Portnoybacteria bacterium]
MSHRVHPKVFRIKGIEDWQSQWFSKKNYKSNLEQDIKIREFLKKELKPAIVDEIIIKRLANSIHIIIKAARPGIIIGRGGAGIQELKKRVISKVFKGKIKGIDIKIDVEEIRKAETKANIIGQAIAEQLERRMPFRRVIKQTIEKAIQNPEVKGIKVSVSGRLNGSEMARDEKLIKGSLPLQTIRANIDYAQVNAYTIYGVIGIKIWINKGEVFEK